MVYELPRDATHCPKGHKRLMRLFNKIGVVGTRHVAPDPNFRLTNSSRFQRSQPALQDAYDHQDKHKLQDTRMRSHEASQKEMVALSNVLGVPGGKGRPMDTKEIRETLKRDPYAPSSLMARQWDRGIPAKVKTA